MLSTEKYPDASFAKSWIFTQLFPQLMRGLEADVGWT